jgi:hypothetical protein
MKFVSLGALIVLLTITACNTVVTNNTSFPSILQSVKSTETTWLLKLQMKEPVVAPNQPAYGAIIKHDTFATTNKEYLVDPYFSNLAMTGLLESNSQSTEVQTTVKRWLQWYFNHMSTTEPTDARCQSASTRLYVDACDLIPGTVAVYFYAPGTNTETSTGKMDSADSYAATFISLLRKYYDATKDKAFLVANRTKIRLARDVFVNRTWVANSKRTIAKPSYPIEFLMDNCEVLEALENIKALESELGLLNDTQGAVDTEVALVQSRLTDLQVGIEQLYNPAKGLYFSSDDAMKKGDIDIDTKFYPNATAQLAPIWTGVLSGSNTKQARASDLWQKFNAAWDQPNVVKKNWTSGSIPDDFPWVAVTFTAALMNDTTRAEKHIRWLQDKYSVQHQWTWYNAESGWLLRAANRLAK